SRPRSCEAIGHRGTETPSGDSHQKKARRGRPAQQARPEPPLRGAASSLCDSVTLWQEFPPCAVLLCGYAPCNGRSSSFCTLQFVISPTSSSLSLRQSISWTDPNSFSSFPARPNLPSTRPSSSIL